MIQDQQMKFRRCPYKFIASFDEGINHPALQQTLDKLPPFGRYRLGLNKAVHPEQDREGSSSYDAYSAEKSGVIQHPGNDKSPGVGSAGQFGCNSCVCKRIKGQMGLIRPQSPDMPLGSGEVGVEGVGRVVK